MRSNRVKKGLTRAGARSLLYACGVTPRQLERPFIGIANAFTDMVPGHLTLRELSRVIENGISAAGGVPFSFGAPAICDGIAMGHLGMFYSLPSREIIADLVETMAQAHAFDGLVLLTDCDKITPGMLMGAARVNLPAIVVTAGPMHSGNLGGRRLSLVRDTFENVGRCRKGELTEEELREIEMLACPGPGSCQGLYTANTMACLTEAMGMSLPGCATALAGMAKKARLAYESGERIVELVRHNITARTIMTPAAFANAVRMDMALGGSTNTCLHLPAIAYEAGVDLPLDLIDQLSCTTPQITNILPGGEHFMEDFEYAGGVPAALKALGDLIEDTLTVGGQTTREIAAAAKIMDTDVIRTRETAYAPEGGIAVLKGNLAPDGSVVKQSAVTASMQRFTGKAICFDSEETCMEGILGGKIEDGSVIVIRYEGPRGGPGMREMLSPTSALTGMEKEEAVALITDGRFSGGTRGPCVGHISPEAAAGGPLALVQDGDEITIDIPNRRLTLQVSEAELMRRRNMWQAPPPKIKSGWLARYASQVQPANTGAILKASSE
ncbi:MAG: dihydroxy-acid dehydratase [Candidatus Zipacnadales bacterium]